MRQTLGWAIGTVRAWTADVDGIERWFVARGLPHFVERRDSAWAIWGRAAPLLAVAYLLLGLNALDLREWSLTENLVAAVVRRRRRRAHVGRRQRVRRRPAFDRPHDIGPAELAVFIVVPAIAVARRRPAAATPSRRSSSPSPSSPCCGR